MTYLFRRFAAAYLDAIVIVVLILMLEFLFSILQGKSFDEIDTPIAGYWVKLQIISMVIYYVAFEFLFQRTIGKMALKFGIEGLEGELNAKRFIQVLKRTASRFIPLEPFSILLDEKREMWHDKISKTKVVDLRKKSG
jgi:uncharacterized RDD family membrane protein YckC